MPEDEMPSPYIPLDVLSGSPFRLVFYKTKQGTYRLVKLFYGLREFRNKRGIFYIPFLIHREKVYEGDYETTFNEMVKIVKIYNPKFDLVPVKRK